VLLVLVAQHDLVVYLALRVVDFGADGVAKVEVLVLEQQVVVEVQSLLPGELLPEVELELLR